MKPTPLFILALTSIALIVLSVWIMATLHYHTIDQAKLIQTCISETGHKRVECP